MDGRITSRAFLCALRASLGALGSKFEIPENSGRIKPELTDLASHPVAEKTAMNEDRSEKKSARNPPHILFLCVKKIFAPFLCKASSIIFPLVNFFRAPSDFAAGHR
jgi:hypothetical protein